MIYANILVPYDGSDHAEKALEAAAAFAAEGDVKVRLLTVTYPADVDPGLYYDGGGMGPDPVQVELDQELNKSAQQKALTQLKEVAAAHLADVPADHITYDVRMLPVVPDAIVEYAREKHCDLIIMGRHSKKGILDFLGSTAKSVMRKTDLPVLTVE
ncbi:MAG: universal stress protein [Eggerthellaceae bacterium]|nr:universal stress protein [Eggerthellaceae bacterium]